MGELADPIAVFVATLSGGGAERVAVDLAGGLAARGRDVDLVVCDASGPLRSAVPDDVRLVDFDRGKVKRAILPLRRYLRTRRPSAVIAIQTDCNLALLLARGGVAGPVVVATEHNILDRPIGGPLGRRIRRFLIRRLYPRADRLVAVSAGVREDFERLLGRRCPPTEVIYNPVFTEAKFASLAANGRSPSRHPDAAPYILAAGRLTRQKGFDVLIDAFARCAPDIPHDLVILGEGADRPALERRVERLGLAERVSLPGFRPDPYAAFRDASLFVLSSRWEGFGLVIVESLACGTAVVSTDCRSGPREVLRDGELGRLVAVDDPDALADAIVETLADPGLDADETVAARRDRGREFSVASAVDGYLRILAETAARISDASPRGSVR